MHFSETLRDSETTQAQLHRLHSIEEDLSTRLRRPQCRSGYSSGEVADESLRLRSTEYWILNSEKKALVAFYRLLYERNLSVYSVEIEADYDVDVCTGLVDLKE